jgi:hypothetical protein
VSSELRQGRAGIAHRAAPYGWAAGAVLLAWVVMHALRPVPGFPLDDPYIVLHSAQVMHWGFDPNYPGVPALYGVTSAPFLALVYGLLFLLRPLTALDTACWMGVLAYALGLVKMARVLRLGAFEGTSLVVLGMISSFVPIHLLNGLETPWAMAGVAWALAFSSDAQRYARWAALAVGIAGAIRPDLAPFAAFLVIALTVERCRGRQWARRRIAMELGVLAALAIVPLIPGALWYHHATGAFYPLTGAAKRYYMATDHQRWDERLLTEVTLFGVFVITCGPMMAGAFRAMGSAVAKAILGSISLVLLIAFFGSPDSLAWNLFRYQVVFTPMVVWGMGFSLRRDAGWRAGRKMLIASLVYSAVCVLPFSLCLYLRDSRRFDGGVHELAAWCQQTLPAGTRVLVQDAGYIAYGTKLRVIDYVGLKTPEAMTLNKTYSWPTAGRERAKTVAALSLREHADYLIVLGQGADPSTKLPGQMRMLGWGADAVKSEGVYRVYLLRPPK